MSASKTQFDRFPPEKKDQFLNWVMIVEPKDEWAGVVMRYYEYHRIKNWRAGFDFIVKWSHDPSKIAYWMVKKGLAEPEWAMRIIENDKTVNQFGAAYLMMSNGFATQEWYYNKLFNVKTIE